MTSTRHEHDYEQLERKGNSKAKFIAKAKGKGVLLSYDDVVTLL